MPPSSNNRTKYVNNNNGAGATNNTDEEVEYCGSCNDIVSDGDKSLCCEACNKWFHINCINISVSKYKSIGSLQSIVRWFCTQCDVKIKNALSKLALLEAKVSELEAKIELNIEKKIEDMLDERLEREKKKNNLIIFGVPEAPDDNKNKQGAERKQYDIEKLEKLNDGLCDELNIETSMIDNIYRIGKVSTNTNRPRPICIKLKNASDKYRLLNNAKRLREAQSGWQKEVYISLDYTKHQRELRKKAMDELKIRRDAGELNLVIRNFKVVTRPGNPLN